MARALTPKSGSLTRRLGWAVPILLLVFPLYGWVRYAVRGRLERQAMADRGAAPATAPNVLLLVLDTVRAWDLSFQGYWRPTTPKLQRWLERGVVFERALAPGPWTTPSHATMFTGLQPTEVTASWDSPLDEKPSTLAEQFRASGYATAGFVGNYRYAGSASGLERGFDHYEDYPVTVEQGFRSAQLPARVFTLGNVAEQLGKRRLIQGGKDAIDVNTEFLRWLDRSRPATRPFFAFLNYFDAHAPYTPPRPWDSTFAGRDLETVNRYWSRMEEVFGPGPLPRQFLQETHDAYDGGIAYLDFQIDSLLTQLESRGLLHNTVVIITSDHGEHFGEHGLIQHGNSLFLPLLHVPLGFYAPTLLPPGVRIQAPVSLRDLAATILELASVPRGSVPGRSLLEWIRPTAELQRSDTLLAAVDYHRLLPKWPVSPVLRGDMRSIVLDSLHYIHNGDGVEELYHLGRDSRETRNLAGLPEFQPDLERHRAALKAVSRER
jgi:arylsulfatase A-like enzyme